jgi:hypothetical protein
MFQLRQGVFAHLFSVFSADFVYFILKIAGSNGVLVHCISGWDRTPLYISLLRLSLWADGEVHKSLSASDILYLTLAYDWYLFW